MKPLHPRFGAFILLGIGLLLSHSAPARAQGGAPDLSDFGGAIGQKADAAIPGKFPPAPKTGFVSGLAVPRVKPGQTARAVFSILRETAEKESAGQPETAPQIAALKELEKQAPAILTSIEAQMLKIGLAPRDMGSAYAAAFLVFHESATGKKTTDAQDKAVGRIIAMSSAKVMAEKWKKMPPQARELVYETLLMQAAINSMFVEMFAQAGKTEELATLREQASQQFQTLVGVPAKDVSIAANGNLTFPPK